MNEPAYIRISPVFDSSVWNLEVIGEETFVGIAGKEQTMPVYKNLPCEPIGYTPMQVDEKGYAVQSVLRAGYVDPQVFPTKGSAMGAYEKAVAENQTPRYPYWGLDSEIKQDEPSNAVVSVELAEEDDPLFGSPDEKYWNTEPRGHHERDA